MVLTIMLNYGGNEPVNIGVGEDLSIHQLVEMVEEIVGYNGNIIYDQSKPDGAQKNCLIRANFIPWRGAPKCL
jgi:GDP-L-fucose synthase